jgi:hypothetical protein
MQESHAADSPGSSVKGVDDMISTLVGVATFEQSL